ncbi:FadR/GntR family transcriptional regulator [Undibacterium sp. Rencai35W]|uniref:FadR/GntR family transcriptional regulator n=1 Tax=Undibacterium sp. Rencai35W TaxID=3413046 RepID=UPI003BEFA029
MTTTTPALALPVQRKKQRNLAQGVIENISHNIQIGSLKPGDKLPTESAIMEMHGVSRTVVREAISHLQASGLVETRHGIGTFILDQASANLGKIADTMLTMRDVLAVLELRISLETEAAWLAASRRTDEQMVAIHEALKTMQHKTNTENSSVDADVQFHLLIAQATDNRYFVEILSHLGNTIIPRARLNTASLVQDDAEKYLERVNREHEDIYDAILRKDPEAARAAMRTHLSNSRERLRKAQDLMESARA